MRRTIVALSLATLLLAGCSGTSTPPEDPQPEPSSSESQTADETPAAPPPSTSQSATPSAPAAQAEPEPQSTPPPSAPVADVAPVTLASSDAQLALPRPATLPTLHVFAPDDSEFRRLPDPSMSRLDWISEPDRVVFTQRRDGTTWVVAADPATGNVEPLFRTGDPSTLLASPDGKRLAVIARDHPNPATITLLDPATNTAYAIPTSASSPTLSWAPDSSRFLLHSDGRITIYDADANLQLQLELPPSEGFYRGITWAPDVSFVLVKTFLSLRRIDFATGLTTVLFGPADRDEPSLPPVVAVSPDSR